MTVEQREMRINAALDEVEDPEVAITLRDLGVLRNVRVLPGKVEVTMVPTRLACPGRDEMARRVRAAVIGVDPAVEVDINWEMASWTPDDITSRGCSVLKETGYTTSGVDALSCPYCDSSDVAQAAEFGGALCKVPYSCRSCGSTFEALRSAVLPLLP